MRLDVVSLVVLLLAGFIGEVAAAMRLDVVVALFCRLDPLFLRHLPASLWALNTADVYKTPGGACIFPPCRFGHNSGRGMVPPCPLWRTGSGRREATSPASRGTRTCDSSSSHGPSRSSPPGPTASPWSCSPMRRAERLRSASSGCCGG